MLESGMFYLMILFHLFFENSYAGDKAGNGGVSVVCRATNHEIISAKLLDLAEAEEVDHLTLLKFNKRNWKSISKEVIPKLTVDFNELKESIQIKFDHWLKNDLKVIYTDYGFDLPDPKDFLPRIKLNQNCKFETVALYDDKNNELTVLKEIFDKLPNNHKSALFLHEFQYKNARDFSSWELSNIENEDKGHPIENSNKVRVLIGSIFSTKKSEKYLDLLLDPKTGSPGIVCSITKKINGYPDLNDSFNVFLFEKEISIKNSDYNFHFNQISQKMTNVIVESKNSSLKIDTNIVNFIKSPIPFEGQFLSFGEFLKQSNTSDQFVPQIEYLINCQLH